LNWRRSISIWHILLVAINCLLLAAIIQVWWGSGESPSLSRAGKGPQMPKTPMLRDTQPLNAFRVVAAKDLFSQERSGPEPGLPGAAKQDNLEGRKLLGTIIIGNERAAMIGGPTPGKGAKASNVEVVRLGEELGGFKVVEISSEGVVFLGKAGKKTLNFPE
jgi:hypothetical protein